MGLTHYQILEVQPNASSGVIAAAFKARSKELYVDGQPTDEEMIRLVNKAHEVLSNAKKRKSYDAEIEQPPSGVIGGKYRVVEKIATGGFGTTYKAEHTDLPGSLVCVKHAGVISPEYEAILRKEAQAMWDLRHHAIPAVRDYFLLEDGSAALVMGYIEGPTLHDLIEQNGPIVPEDVAWITERILNALSYLHHNGVVHGDLKPKNVIIQPDSHAVALVDFGLAAVRPTAADGSIGYTEYFGPPEAKKGLPLIPESDYFSVGATMLFALSGDLGAVKNRRVPDTVPDPLCEFIRSLMCTQPLQRPSPMEVDLVDSLVAVRQSCFGRRRSGMKPIQHVS